MAPRQAVPRSSPPLQTQPSGLTSSCQHGVASRGHGLRGTRLLSVADGAVSPRLLDVQRRVLPRRRRILGAAHPHFQKGYRKSFFGVAIGNALLYLPTPLDVLFCTPIPLTCGHTTIARQHRAARGEKRSFAPFAPKKQRSESRPHTVRRPLQGPDRAT